MRVKGAYRRMADAQRFPYLEHERCVPAAVLLSPRFAGRMRIDSLGNTVFPHFDAAGLCGYEIKNCGFTGFAAGGQKGLWFSHTQPADRRLILTESAVDALSYAALFPNAEDQTAMPAWVANQARGKGHWSKRLSRSSRQGPRS